MYGVILWLHNIMRWIVVIMAVVAVARGYLGWFGKKSWSKPDRLAGMMFSMSIDIQLLLGLLLYFILSPITTGAFRDLGAAMQVSEMRFFTIEHISYMLLAVILAHVGSALSKKAPADIDKHKRAAIFFTITVIVILIGIPWSRPLLPF
jgi:hypothetical protein